MKDDAMKRVLEGLGKVEAPIGLEGRVSRRLAERGEERREERTNVWRWGLGLATGMALVGVLALSAGVFVRGGGEPTPGAKARILSGGESPKAEALGYLQATAKREEALAPQGGEHTPGAKARILGGRESPKAEALGYLQATAHGEGMESFPAPSEPLTEQERLLVRVARHPRAGEVEFLIAEVREAALMKSDAEFDQFFPAPAPVEEMEAIQPEEGKENNNEIQPIVR